MAVNVRKNVFNGAEVARLLGVSRRTARGYLQRGLIPATQHPLTGSWAVNREDLVAYMKECGMNVSELASPLRALIVDDEELVVRFAAECLRRTVPHALIQTTSNGYDAILKVGAEAPDLVVLDAHLDGLDGREVLRSIKEANATRHVKILAISGHADAVAEMVCYGADEVIPKPFGVEKFREKIGKLFPEMTISMSQAAPQTAPRRKSLG